MSTFSISPRAPLHRHWPAVALLALLLVLSISHVYLQLAFPLHAVGLSLGLAVLAAGMLVVPQPQEEEITGQAGARKAIRGARPDLYRVALGLQAIWLIWNGIELLRAPVPAVGRTEFATVFQGFLVFWIVAEAVRRWGHLPVPVEKSSEAQPGTAKEGSKSLSAEVGVGMTPQQIVGLWWALGGIALSGYGLYQVLGPVGWPKTFATLHERILTGLAWEAGTDRTINSVLHALKEGRAFSTFGAPNIFGGYLVAVLMILAAWATGSRSRAGRIVAGLGGLVVGWALILSQSRGAMLALVVAAGWLAFRWWRVSARMRAATAAAVALMVFLIPRPIPAVAPPDLQSSPTAASGGSTETAEATGPEPRTLLEHLQSPTTVQQRLHYWESALALWARGPFTGGGGGSYQVFYPQLRRPGSGETIYAHSWVFQFGSETGMVGLALFVAAVVAALGSGEKSLRALGRAEREGLPGLPREGVGLLVGFEAATVGLLVHGLADYTLSHRELYLDLEMILGLLAGTWACAGAGTGTASHTVGWWTRPAARVGASLAVIVLGFVVYVPTVIEPLWARFYATAAHDLVVEPEQREEALRLYRRAVAWEPDNPSTMASLGMVELDMGNPRGLDQILRATQANPYSASLQALLARAYDMTGSPEAAEAALRKAVELHPLDPDHRFDLVEWLLRRGRVEEARDQFARALEVPMISMQYERMEALRAQLDAAGKRK